MRILDELALAGPEHRDPEHVARYGRKASFDPTEDVALLQQHGLGAEGTLVDLGAGTGTLAFAAARHCRRVVAVDISPAMVAAMASRAVADGVTNVECVRAGFLSYEHTGAAPDAVYSRNALHHLPDFWKVLALLRIARLLRPGGRFHLRDLVIACEPGDAERVVADWLEGAVADAEDGWTRAELEGHLASEHSTFSWLLEPMLTHAGFSIELASYRRRVYAHYVCAATTR